MFVFAMFTISFFLFIPFFVFFLVLACAKKSRRRLSIPILIAVLFAGGLLSLLGSRKDSVQSVSATPIIHAEDQKAVPSDPTLEALWDKLTKSRINLAGETESLPLADPQDEAAQLAVRKTFGIGEQGKLPPNWVITPPKWVGQVYRESVASDPFVTEAECRRQLEQEQLPQAVARRIEHLASAQIGHPVVIDSPLEIGIGPDYILREICRDDFLGTVDVSFGEMKKVHVLLEFNPPVDQHLEEAWLRHERGQRLFAFSKILALSLTGLAAIYGLLRFDTWSKGYYSKQLLVGGVLAIIAFAVVFF